MILRKLYVLVDILTMAVLVMLLIDVVYFCAVTASCKAFIPTLSYISTYRNHDTFLVFAACVQAFVMFLTFVSFHTCKVGKETFDDMIYLKLLESGIIVLILTMSIVDESNGTDFKEIEKFHKFITVNLVYFLLLWSAYVIWQLRLIEMNGYQRRNFYIAIGISLVLLLLFGVCGIEWALASSVYSNWYINPYFEGLFDWVFIILSVRFPYHISRICDNDLILIKE